MSHDPNRTPGKREQRIIDRVKKLTSDLPEVDVGRDGFGHTVFKVRKKTFVMIGDAGDGRGSLSIKADHATQALLIEQGPWIRTPYIGQHGWVTGMGDAKLDWEEVGVLLRDAFRLAAPKKLARQIQVED